MKCPCSQYSVPLITFDDIVKRSESSSAIRQLLTEIASDKTHWISVLKCKECGSYWAEEYPFSEYHGGGAPCYYQIETTAPEIWLKTNSGITHQIRQQHEDDIFIGSLGEEVGPEKCKTKGCNNLRIYLSSMCRKHHFEMVQKRSYPV
jgi:hypothetical protein